MRSAPHSLPERRMPSEGALLIPAVKRVSDDLVDPAAAAARLLEQNGVGHGVEQAPSRVALLVQELGSLWRGDAAVPRGIAQDAGTPLVEAGLGLSRRQDLLERLVRLRRA